LETAVASCERNSLEVEALEVAPVEAAAAGNEKPHGQETSGLSAFNVVDKLKSVGR